MHQRAAALDVAKETVAEPMAFVRALDQAGNIGEPYPSWAIVGLMVEAGLPLVPGSDAHQPAQVGAGLEALEGTRLVRYRGRRILEQEPGLREAPGA